MSDQSRTSYAVVTVCYGGFVHRCLHSLPFHCSTFPAGDLDEAATHLLRTREDTRRPRRQPRTLVCPHLRDHHCKQHHGDFLWLAHYCFSFISLVFFPTSSFNSGRFIQSNLRQPTKCFIATTEYFQEILVKLEKREWNILFSAFKNI